MAENFGEEEHQVDELLAAIEIETASAPRLSVIWMHGLGADGSDFVPVVPELGLDTLPGVRFIFPHARKIPVTCNGGYVMRAWYDIVSLDSTSRTVDEQGIIDSRQAIRRLMARENQRGMPCSRIVLAGFSQGGAIAYVTALTHPETLAGVIGLSTYIPTPKLIEAEATDANRAVPIFAAHGTKDSVVSPELGVRAREFLVGHGYRVEWHEYPMTHSVCIEEIEEIGRFLRERLAAVPAD
jgi:phospholipase/carboxylesterase